MTELSDSVIHSSDEIRSPLGIDLNEVPLGCGVSETLSGGGGDFEVDAFSVVRSYHQNLTPADGAPAEVPNGGEEGEKGCAACELPEMSGYMVVCDGCERGFHLSCTGKGRQPESYDEWICGECVCVCVKSKRWPLGFRSNFNSVSSSGIKQGSGGVRLLDINSLPPSDGEGEGSEALQEPRKHISDNSFGVNTLAPPLIYSRNLYAGNGFGFQRAPEIVSHSVLGFEDQLHHTQTMAKNRVEINFGFPPGMPRYGNGTAIRLQSRNPSEMFLQSLREFISERHGVLEEGWSVEVRQSMGSCELHAIYHAPDGNLFGSMAEVAYHLGLTFNGNSLDSEVRCEGSASLQKRPHSKKRRKSTRAPVANGLIENKETFLGGIPALDMENMEICASEFDTKDKFTGSGSEGNWGTGCQEFDDALPLQFEDFFIVSLGKIDIRPSYHDASNIWPVGYKSCFHDNITGSFFICDVLDGGEPGPIFRVRRCSCSTLPIPVGSTIIFRPNLGHISGQNEETDGITSFHVDCDEDGSIQMILSELCPPMENDIMSCLESGCNEDLVAQTTNPLKVESNSGHEAPGSILSGNMGLGDEIGEFSEEGRSPASVWRTVCQRVIEDFCKVYKQKGSLNLLCKHFEMRSSSEGIKNENSKSEVNSIAKLSSSSGYAGIVSLKPDDYKLETLSKVLSLWLDQDRFGLEMEFVQEILEQLPGVHSCSHYKFLNKRSSYSTMLTVGNGHLHVKSESKAQGKEEALNNLFRGRTRPKVQEDEDSQKVDCCPPVGKPLGTRLPYELVGDAIQVWEFFWRFHEILGLTEPFSFEELEDELINPWCDGLNVINKNGREEQQDITSHGTGAVDFPNGHVLSSSSEPVADLASENLHTFIPMETGAMKEAAQARLASVTYSRCTGIAMTKAHNSLLKALVTELQSKVAGLVDPSFNAGESKTRRGKRKDYDISIASKKNKLNMLPVNEFTWPEVARRYVLAVVTLDGNLDSPESLARESGKVFRCLQGDGGVLCGSLTGVAGMKADALLLAEATKQIFSSLDKDIGVLIIDHEEPDLPTASEPVVENNATGTIPAWALMLEPVRKLPTNVGTRIRKCVYDALEKGPPEWAKEILEHSISKGVYKGNASGPTKKAVLSVLATISGEGLQPQPEKERINRSVLSISEIIMRKCRILLRGVATEDEGKFFCNLLGQNLMNSGDTDDEGFLGSPAMVSRPLDFRVLDFRLAVGAYGASPEAFLEDVQELRNNMRTAFIDQPDMVEIAETLFQKVESFYENEVLVLVHKLTEYSKLESLDTETKKEIEDIVVSTADLPKAPWDEGVCKVCGIDKNDDSVLLCDTCDAEYHTYCLKPPLATIPEGNWYCPSCVSRRSLVPEALGRTQVIYSSQRRRYRGEYSRQFLEALTNLAAVGEEKEYWDCTLNERTLLLKFLCDELLNTGLIHQHLEQCAETSAELQQKVRAFSAEWRNLKLREEIMVSRAAKLVKNLVHAVGEASNVDVPTTALPNLAKCLEPLHGDKRNSDISDHLSELEADHRKTGHCGLDKQLSLNSCGGKHISDNQVSKHVDNDNSCGDDRFNTGSCKKDNSFEKTDLSLSSAPQQEICGGASSQGNLQEFSERDLSKPSSSDSQGVGIPSEKKNNDTAECAPPVIVNQSHVYELELNAVKGDILVLQDSIASLESQFLKQPIRREFLGSDNAGRLYWATAKPGHHPWVIVDGSSVLHQDRSSECQLGDYNETSHTPLTGKDATKIVGSKGSTPWSWVSYQTDAEIEELIGWLQDIDPKEKELKESILHLRRLRFQDQQKTTNLDQDDSQKPSSVSKNCNQDPCVDSLVTKATTLLQRNYDPCLETENSGNSRKRSKKAKGISEGKMYRCECLESIWPSRHHCLSCHHTFPTEVELVGHNDRGCGVISLASDKGKEHSECSKWKGLTKLKATHEDGIGVMDKVEASKKVSPALSPTLIKFQNEGLVCPFDFEEICSKFITNDSNKDLVQEIGLIATNGVPLFVPSQFPYLSDSTLVLGPQKEIGISKEDPNAVEEQTWNKIKTKTAHYSADNSVIGSASKNNSRISETGVAVGYPKQKDAKHYLNSWIPEKDIGHCCVISESSLRPLVGRVSQILRHLKINLLDMEAALPEESLKTSKSNLQKRWAWRSFVKSARNIFEMLQAIIVLEDMIKAEYLRNDWWYWSSLSAAANISTVSSLALRIYALEAAIIYENISMDLDPADDLTPNSKLEQKTVPSSDPSEKVRNRRVCKRRKESEG